MGSLLWVIAAVLSPIPAAIGSRAVTDATVLDSAGANANCCGTH